MMNYTSRLQTAYQIVSRRASFKLLMRDFFKISNPVQADAVHLQAAMQWLCRAQDATSSGGVSQGFSMKNGWLPPYPETTGYLIPTFLKYAAFSKDKSYFERAVHMGEWELKLQMPSGAFPGSAGTGGAALVFDTGQIIQGLTTLFRATDNPKWLNAVIRAATWIISIQEENGSWENGSHKNIPHAYYTRVAWPLFELAEITGNEDFKKSAQVHLDWVLSLRNKNDWINNMGFSQGKDPLTHTLAYTYEGLHECMRHVAPAQQSEILEILQEAMKHVIAYEQHITQKNYRIKAMPAFVDQDWNFYGEFSCLVGNCQLALVLLHVYQSTRQAVYYENAVKILDQIKSVQVFDEKDSDLHGGIGGALPIWGGYGSLSLINWAGKFFADALMLKSEVLNTQK